MRAFRLTHPTRPDLPRYVTFAASEASARAAVKALTDDAAFWARIDAMIAVSLTDAEVDALDALDAPPSGVTLAHAAVRLGARAYLHPVLIEPPSSTVRPRG